MTTLLINGLNDLHLLDHIPTEVIKLVISNLAEPIALPKLPAHVEELTLVGASLIERTCFSEGLKRLTLELIGKQPSTTKWSYPSSLERVSIQSDTGGVIDLRGVTAPKLTVIQNDLGFSVLYPEGLNALSLERGAFDESPLPPYLQELTLHGTTIGQTELVYPSLKRLTLNVTEVKAHLGQIFPHLEVLKLQDYYFPELKIESSTLQELTLEGASIDEPIVLDAPSLETLTILSASPEDNIDLSLNTELGHSLVELILESAMAFPVETEWPQLKSLTLIESDVEVPFCPRLSHFETDMPVLTNDVEVETLDEYKAAWNL